MAQAPARDAGDDAGSDLLTSCPMSLTQPIGLNEPDTPPENGGPTPTHDGNGKLSPMLEQYIEIKAANPD